MQEPCVRGFSTEGMEARRPRGCGPPAQGSAWRTRPLSGSFARQRPGQGHHGSSASFTSEYDLSLFSQQRSRVLGVGGNPPPPVLQGCSCRNLSLAAYRLTQATSFPVQVAVNGAQFLMHRALMEACCLSHIRTWMSPRGDESTPPTCSQEAC